MNPWTQAEILTERYFSSLLGRLGALALFLIQGPVIAGLICLVWKGSKADARLELFLCIAALWVGCLNACREICSERPLYRRERTVFLQIRPYVFSKFLVLSGINATQTFALLWIIHTYVGLAGSKLLLFLTLMVAASLGTLLGLFLSALVSSADKALALVPLAILPQLLLSRPFLPSGSPSALVEKLEKLMPLRWSYEVYKEVLELPKNPDLGALAFNLLVCLALGVALFAFTCLALWSQDDGS